MQTDPSDPSQFSVLFDEAAPALFAWASIRIRPSLRIRIDPEDLVQEVCCRAFTARSRYNPERGPFRAWVFGIARIVLKKALEDLVRTPHASAYALSDASVQLLANMPDEVSSITSRVARTDEVRKLIEIAKEMPDEDRRLLSLRGLMGLRHAEIAERMELTVEVIEKRWQRLRKRLLDASGTKILVP